MRALLRAGCFAALTILASFSAIAADKAYPARRPGRSRGRLEAQIKSDAGHGRQAGRAAAPRGRRRLPEERLRARHGAARPDRRDRRPTTAPTGCGSRAPSMQIARRRRSRAHASCSSAPAPPPTSPISAPNNRSEEAEALTVLGRSFARPKNLAAGARRAAAVARVARGGRRSARNTRGCARTTASACSTTRSMPTPRRRAPASSFPRTLPAKRTDFSPVRLGRRHGQAGALRRGEAALRRGPQARRALRRHVARRPAVDRARRRWRSRPTSRSMCATASRSCASPARPMCCRAPASAAFRWSASIPRRCKSQVYRIGDRNLIDTVLGRDFQRNLDRYDVERLAREPRHEGVERRACGRADAQHRSHHRIPGRPGGRRTAARRLRDGGRAERHAKPTIHDALATQWFIVSDLGLTAYSGNDGIHVVRALARHDRAQGPGRGAAASSRSNEVLATSAPMRQGCVQFEAGLARGEGGAGARHADRRRRRRATTLSSI